MDTLTCWLGLTVIPAGCWVMGILGLDPGARFNTGESPSEAITGPPLLRPVATGLVRRACCFEECPLFIEVPNLGLMTFNLDDKIKRQNDNLKRQKTGLQGDDTQTWQMRKYLKCQ